MGWEPSAFTRQRPKEFVPPCNAQSKTIDCAPHGNRPNIAAAGSLVKTAGFFPLLSVFSSRAKSDVNNAPSEVQLKLRIFSPSTTSGIALADVLPAPGKTKRLLTVFC